MVKSLGADNVIDYLKENFVVLYDAEFVSQNGIGSVLLPKTGGYEAKRHALAIWVSFKDDPAPIQAAGGWLK